MCNLEVCLIGEVRINTVGDEWEANGVGLFVKGGSGKTILFVPLNQIEYVSASYTPEGSGDVSQD